MLKANFTAYGSYVTDSLYQWDLNRVLQITGIKVSTNPEVHFSNAVLGRAIVKQAKVSNNVVTVDIPNSVLQYPLRIYAYVGVYRAEEFKVLETVEIPVIPRTRPSDYQLEVSDEELYSFNRLENKINNIDEKWSAFTTEAVDTAVNAWLTEHPEATTTVQDHSLTVDKMVVGTLGYVTPQMFGAKGDGVTDDTAAFTTMIASHPSVIIIPKGTYAVTQVDFSGLTNCRVICAGEFLNNNTDDVYGVVIAGGTDNVFDGIAIDGNAIAFTETETRYGLVCSLLVNTNATRCTFRNVTIKNALYCGVIFNDGVTDCKFYDTHFTDIGEHCFYIGGAKGIVFDGIDVKVWGCNPLCAETGHDCEIIKQANRSSSDIRVKNVVAISDEDCMSYGFNVNACEGFEIDGVAFATKKCFVISGQSVTGFKVRNAKITGSLSSSYFNSPAIFTDCDLSGIGQFPVAKCVFNDCRFAINYAEFYLADAEFNNCHFDFISNTIRLYQHKDMIFNNCAFVSSAATAQSVYLFTDMNANEDEYTITLNNCRMDSTNYSGGFYGNKKINLAFKGCDLSKLSANSGILALTMTDCICANALAWSGWSSESAYCNNVRSVAGVSTSKVRKVVEIPSGSNVALVTGLRYLTFRKCVIEDVILMNTTNNVGVYAELVDSTDNQTLRIKALETVNSKTTVVVIIDLND